MIDQEFIDDDNAPEPEPLETEWDWPWWLECEEDGDL